MLSCLVKRKVKTFHSVRFEWGETRQCNVKGKEKSLISSCSCLLWNVRMLQEERRGSLDSKEVARGIVDWKIPTSWKHFYGTKFDQTLFHWSLPELYRDWKQTVVTVTVEWQTPATKKPQHWRHYYYPVRPRMKEWKFFHHPSWDNDTNKNNLFYFLFYCFWSTVLVH